MAACRAAPVPVRREHDCGCGNTAVGSPGYQAVTESAESTDEARGRAFQEYVEPEIEVMLRVARSLTGNAADAEDLVQESLLRAYRGLDGFDGRHPRAWLLTIVRNTNMNMHRRKRPDTIADWDLVRDARPAFGAAASASAEDVVLDGTLSDQLTQAIAELDPRFRAALILVDVNDLSYAEAAAVLDVPIGTVMSRLSRARDRVRRRLGPAVLTPGGLT